MAIIWKNRIIAGTKTFAQCPERYREEVVERLEAAVANGEITEETLKELLK